MRQFMQKLNQFQKFLLAKFEDELIENPVYYIGHGYSGSLEKERAK